MRIKYLTTFVAISLMFLSGQFAVLAKGRDGSCGRGHGPHKRAIQYYDRDDDFFFHRHRHKGGSFVRFHPKHKRHKHDDRFDTELFFDRSNLPPGLAKRRHLPPGLRRQLRDRGSLPPGLEKRRTGRFLF